MFLVLEENAPLLQWLDFFRQFNAIGPLFCSFAQLLRQLIFRLSEATEAQTTSFLMFPKVEGRPKDFGFFRHYAIFSQNFLNSMTGCPLIFLNLSVCKKRLMSLKGLFLDFLALCDFFTKYFFE